MKILFDFDEKKCSACGACAIACMDQNDLDAEAGQQPYRKVYQYESGGEHVYMSIACLHCPDAPCVTACPVGCLSKDEATGLTRFDNTNCIGCHSCAMACPYGAPSFRSTGDKRPREKMEKCHGCLERIEAGLTPACVHACPTGALTWRWAEDDEISPLAALYASWKALT
ncbi:MAG: 4Fe-4S dicluster domain-containing protein [Oscillospiraceae bacterium]|nr:4Fe-4S dicluster domain-containing protein [Oscillospiraceae bacterium]